MKTTLSISVFDAIKVSDNYKEKTYKSAEISDIVFNVLEFSFIQELFSNINNFCRPPTSLISNLYATRNHLAF